MAGIGQPVIDAAVVGAERLLQRSLQAYAPRYRIGRVLWRQQDERDGLHADKYRTGTCRIMIFAPMAVHVRSYSTCTAARLSFVSGARLTPHHTRACWPMQARTAQGERRCRSRRTCHRREGGREVTVQRCWPGKAPKWSPGDAPDGPPGECEFRARRAAGTAADRRLQRLAGAGAGGSDDEDDDDAQRKGAAAHDVRPTRRCSAGGARAARRCLSVGMGGARWQRCR